eukprot:g2989.t1
MSCLSCVLRPRRTIATTLLGARRPPLYLLRRRGFSGSLPPPPSPPPPPPSGRRGGDLLDRLFASVPTKVAAGGGLIVASGIYFLPTFEHTREGVAAAFRYEPNAAATLLFEGAISVVGAVAGYGVATTYVQRRVRISGDPLLSSLRMPYAIFGTAIGTLICFNLSDYIARYTGKFAKAVEYTVEGLERDISGGGSASRGSTPSWEHQNEEVNLDVPDYLGLWRKVQSTSNSDGEGISLTKLKKQRKDIEESRKNLSVENAEGCSPKEAGRDGSIGGGGDAEDTTQKESPATQSGDPTSDTSTEEIPVVKTEAGMKLVEALAKGLTGLRARERTLEERRNTLAADSPQHIEITKTLAELKQEKQDLKDEAMAVAGVKLAKYVNNTVRELVEELSALRFEQEKLGCKIGLLDARKEKKDLEQKCIQMDKRKKVLKIAGLEYGENIGRMGEKRQPGSVRVDPLTVVEMLASENLAPHFATLAQIIADNGATTDTIDKAMHRAMVECFAVINEHARVVNREGECNDSDGTGHGTTNTDKDDDDDSVAAITDLGVRLGEMRALPPSPSAPEIIEMTQLPSTWHASGAITRFECNSIQRLAIEGNTAVCSILQSVLHPSPKATLETDKKNKRRSFLSMGGKTNSNASTAEAPTKIDDFKQSADLRPILIAELKMELAQILLRAWDAGHVSNDLLRGRGTTPSIDVTESNSVNEIAGSGASLHELTGQHYNLTSGSDVMTVGKNGAFDMTDGAKMGLENERREFTLGRSNQDRIGSSRHHSTVHKEGKIVSSYTLTPPDSTNVIAQVLEAGHTWEVRIEVGPEQGIIWEFWAHPADKTEFSLRFNGALMFPEAMLASEAPNVGSIRRTEAGTYCLYFRNKNLPGKPGRGRSSSAPDRLIDIWCSIRCPSDGDVIERRNFVRMVFDTKNLVNLVASFILFGKDYASSALVAEASEQPSIPNISALHLSAIAYPKGLLPKIVFSQLEKDFEGVSDDDLGVNGIKARVDRILLGWTLLQDRVGIPMSSIFAVILGTCFAAIRDCNHSHLNKKYVDSRGGGQGKQFGAYLVVEYCLLLLSSPAYESKLLRHPTVLDVLSQAETDFMRLRNLHTKGSVEDGKAQGNAFATKIQGEVATATNLGATLTEKDGRQLIIENPDEYDQENGSRGDLVHKPSPDFSESVIPEVNVLSIAAIKSPDKSNVSIKPASETPASGTRNRRPRRSIGIFDSLGVVGSTLKNSCPDADHFEFLQGNGADISLGDFSLFTFASADILLAQSILVEPSLAPLIVPASLDAASTGQSKSSNRLYHQFGNMVVAGKKSDSVGRRSQSGVKFSAAPPLPFEMVRKFSGVARLDSLEGSTLRELGVEELMELLLTEEGVVVGSGSPGIMGVAGIFDKQSGNSGAKTESESLRTSSAVEEHSARSSSGSISSIADGSIAGYQSASMVASSASAAAAGGIGETGETFLPNPHRQFIDLFAAQFRAAANHPNHRLHNNSRSRKSNERHQSETLLKLTINAIRKLSTSVHDDLCVAAPWSLPDVNDSFEDDINAVDNDGGRRTAYGMFHTTKDAVMAATADGRAVDVGSVDCTEDEAAWPYVKGCWRNAIINMDAIAYPTSPYRKMQAISAVFQAIEEEVQLRELPALTADTLLPVLLYVVCRTKLKFKHATVQYILPFVEANRSIDRGAGRDLFCLANLDMVLRLAAKFPNFFEG